MLVRMDYPSHFLHNTLGTVLGRRGMTGQVVVDFHVPLFKWGTGKVRCNIHHTKVGLSVGEYLKLQDHKET